MDDDIIFFGEFNGTNLQDLRSKRSHFQHFIVGNLFHLGGLWHDARVSGVDSVNIRQNLADISLQSCGNSHGRRVGATTSQGRDIVITINPLKACDNNNGAIVQVFTHAGILNLLDTRFCRRAVGVNRHLPAQITLRFIAHRLQCHR